jgi:hypothetical protein
VARRALKIKENGWENKTNRSKNYFFCATASLPSTTVAQWLLGSGTVALYLPGSGKVAVAKWQSAITTVAVALQYFQKKSKKKSIHSTFLGFLKIMNLRLNFYYSREIVVF